MNLNEFHTFKLSDAVKFHDKLNPKLFRLQRLDPAVKKQLLTIAKDFMAELGISGLNVEDITISGSNAAYTYTDHSDLDLHILVDMSKLSDDEVYKELFSAKKTVYNDSHNITIRGIPVELYVQDSREPVVSLGEYSLLKNKWLKLPTKRRANFDQNATKAKYDKLMDVIDLAFKTKNEKTVDKVIRTVKRYRQAGLDRAGEFGPENLAYKALRSQGVIQKLYDLRDKVHSKKLSIENTVKPVQPVVPIQKTFTPPKQNPYVPGKDDKKSKDSEFADLLNQKINNVNEELRVITKLKPQLFVSRQKTTESLKPDASVWTSTAQKTANGYTSEWVEWCKHEMPDWLNEYGTLYDVAPGARILQINSDQEAIQVARHYGMKINDPLDLFMKMKWHVIARDYDAIHHVPTHRMNNMYMRSWDVESTAWFNPEALINPRRVKINLEGIEELNEEPEEWRPYQGLRPPKNELGVNLFPGKDIVGKRVYHCTNSLKAIQRSGVIKPRPDETGAREYGRLSTNEHPFIPVVGVWFSVGKPDWPGKYCLSFVVEPSDEVYVAYAKSNGDLTPNVVLNSISIDRLRIETRDKKSAEQGVAEGSIPVYKPPSQFYAGGKQIYNLFRNAFPNLPEHVANDIYNQTSPGTNETIVNAIKQGKDPKSVFLDYFTGATFNFIKDPGTNLTPSQMKQVLLNGVWKQKILNVNPADFSEHSRNKFVKRNFGVNPNEDPTRIQRQQSNARGDGSNEPVIIIQTSNGLTLWEGFHRTMSILALGRNGQDPMKWDPVKLRAWVVSFTNKQGVAEGSKNLNYIGNCTDDDVIEHIFGDATNFAQAVEEHGDEFTIDDLVVKYDPESDVHSFYYKKQGVAEAFDQPYKLKWEKGDFGDVDAYAKMDDGNYLSIMFNKGYNQDNEEAWSVEFYRNNSQEVTGEGDQFRIFATVLDAIKKFIRHPKYKPNRVIFAASKEVEPGQNAQSRANLYDTLVQRYAKALGFKAFRADTGNKVIYELSRIKKDVTEGEVVSMRARRTPLVVAGSPFNWNVYDLRTNKMVANVLGGDRRESPLYEIRINSNGMTPSTRMLPTYVLTTGPDNSKPYNAYELVDTPERYGKIEKSPGPGGTTKLHPDADDQLRHLFKMLGGGKYYGYDLNLVEEGLNQWDLVEKALGAKIMDTDTAMELDYTDWDPEDSSSIAYLGNKNPKPVDDEEGLTEASGYIPSEREKNDPRFKTALTVDVKPDSIKKNARAFGSKISRAGIPPQLNTNGKF